MATPPPVPAASNPVPPPVTKIAIVDLKTGLPTITFISFLTQLWAALEGDGGTNPQVAALTDRVDTVYAMHGDGTLAEDGTLTITATEGTPFGPFATGTDADDLTGSLDPARIADNSLPYATLADGAGALLLGANVAGPIVGIGIGSGLIFVGTALTEEAAIVTTVAGLPAQPYPLGSRRFVSDAAAPIFGAAVAGGGAIPVPVYSTGAAWFVG